MIDATFPFWQVKGLSETAASLVRNCMKGEHRLAHSRIAAFSKFLQRPINSLAKDPPLFSQKIRECAVVIFNPHCPLTTRSLDCFGPVSKSAWWPSQSIGGSKKEMISP